MLLALLLYLQGTKRKGKKEGREGKGRDKKIKPKNNKRKPRFINEWCLDPEQNSYINNL
jgi:hypothetical protein